MVHELGKHWPQPPLSEILVDDIHALMSERTLGRLSEYSASVPSGVYAGKMWKRRVYAGWFLCWYGPGVPNAEGKTNGLMYTYARKVLIL